MHHVINSWLMAPQTNVRTSYTLLNLFGVVKKDFELFICISFSYTMVNTLAALVCGGHIVELKGSIPCSNNIVLSEVDNSNEKKLHIGFINNIDDNEMKYLPNGYIQSVIESQKTKYRFCDLY